MVRPHTSTGDELTLSPFVDQAFLERIGTMSVEEMDTLSFGVIGLDDAGQVVRYNRFEAELTRTSPEVALGANFFAEVAPCTGNREIWGRFETGVAEGKLNHVTPYVFSYRMAPMKVRLHLYRCLRTATNWLLVKPEGDAPFSPR